MTDREISTNTKKAVEFILTKADPELGFKAQSDKNRLGNPSKVEPEKMTQLFKDLLGAENITTYGPKQGPNPSGKFTMYEMDTDQFGLVRIIVSSIVSLEYCCSSWSCICKKVVTTFFIVYSPAYLIFPLFHLNQLSLHQPLFCPQVFLCQNLEG